MRWAFLAFIVIVLFLQLVTPRALQAVGAPQTDDALGLGGGLGPSSAAPLDVVSGGNGIAITTGNVSVLVVAAEFPDIPYNVSIATLQSEWNQVAKYYQEVSYGKLALTFSLLGWVKLPYNEAHYGADCPGEPGGGIDDAGCSGQDESWNIAQDAAVLVRSNVTFANYDYYVFLHSGNGQESSGVSNDVWSVTYIGGVPISPCLNVQENCNQLTITRFSIVPELEAGGAVPFGVYCHEFGHLLGLPDLYNTNTGKSRNGPWELMDAGTWNGHPFGSMPAELSAWSRMKLEWLPTSSIEVLNPDLNEHVLVNPLESSNLNGYRAAIVEASNAQSYFLEVREPIGFDVGLPDWGVVAYSIQDGGGSIDMFTLPRVDNTQAFHVGSSFATAEPKEGLAFKVVAGPYRNGSYLVSFGPEGYLDPTQGSVLTITVSPTFNMSLTADNQTYITDQNGDVTISNPDNSAITVTVPYSIQTAQGTREKFSGWSNGANSTTLTLTITSNSTLTVYYKLQYYVTITTLYGTPTGSGWQDAGSVVKIFMPSPVNSTEEGVRYVFNDWNGDFSGTTNPATVIAARPLNITVSWTTQFYVDLDVGSHATVTGAGWYKEGATATFTLTVPKPWNGTWYLFQGWSGDYQSSSPTGQVKVTKPLTITAVWRVMLQITFNFLYGNGTPVLPTRVTSIALKAPNGTTIIIENPAESANLWFDQGSYSVVNATVFSMNAAFARQSFKIAPNEKMKIHLNLFDLKFTVRDIILRTPIDGGEVTVTAPNDQLETADLVQGQAVILQLPPGTYHYSVTKPWGLGITGSVDLNEFATAPVQVDMIILLPTVGVIVIAVAVAIAVLLLAKTRKLGLSFTKRKTTVPRSRRKRLSPELRVQLEAIRSPSTATRLETETDAS